ncbi:MAG TPA: cysteine rich repeat-containing protein [Anaeromyxobacteraceae bacterium]|nr:cysteine rich repeat-containing protein [Anaeromyxobacteraceae bacterium]
MPHAVDPCVDDVKRLCSEVRPGGGRIMACLRTQASALGDACREKVDREEERARQVIRDFGQACRADVDRVCGSTPAGGGRVIACLGRRIPELSRPCQGEVERLLDARDRVEEFRKLCGADLVRLCAGVPQEAGALLECIEDNRDGVSAACRATDFRAATEAAAFTDLVDQLTSRDRIRESLEILQGLDSVAFSRSQVLIQVDSFQSVLDKANMGRLLFNPQFVIGDRGQFSLQLKVPISALFPYATAAGVPPTQFGLGAVVVQGGWNFLNTGGMRHFLSFALQMPTASSPPVGGPWAVIPAYAFGMGLARWVSLTTQVVWMRSLGSNPSYADLNVLYVEPIVAFNLPGRSFVALDTKLGWNFNTGTFIPIMKGVAGIFLDRQKSVSVSAWYQGALTQPAADQFFKYAVGAGIAYFFDW